MPSKPKRSHHKKVAPKRSHQKKVTGYVPPAQFQTTATTFWKRMEPSMHQFMGNEIFLSGVKEGNKEQYKAVVRRVYRAAILSACTFFLKETKPSQAFMNQQGTQALCKAIKKSIFETQGDNSGFDDDSDCQQR